MTESYIKLFGKPQTELKHIFSPYRVCPIGAHVDHQHGLVTGFAIDKGVDLIYAPTEDGSVSLRSLTFDGDIDFSVRIPALVRQGNWGGTWRMPTYAEWAELRNEANFKWDWTDNYEGTGIAGRIVTSKVSGYAGNTIFLPTAGSRFGTSLGDAGSRGHYWSSSLDESYSVYARSVFFDSEGVYSSDSSRYYGFSVRPVSE